MKIPHTKAAFTLIELILIVAVVLLLTLVLLPSMRTAKERSHRTGCVNNLKQVGLSFRMWAQDGNDAFPMRTGTNGGGSLEVSNQVWRTFLTMSNELGTPKLLLCPADTRRPAPTWESLANSNLSYFICLDADEGQPQMLLSGDWNLTNSRPPTNHVMTVTPGDPVGWTAALHGNYGNMALSDGSVQGYDTARLRQAVTNAGPAYYQGRTNEPMRLALPE